MEDNIDFSAAPIVEGTASKEELGPQLFKMVIDVCNGQLTKAELIGHQEFAIHRIGSAAIADVLAAAGAGAGAVAD